MARIYLSLFALVGVMAASSAFVVVPTSFKMSSRTMTLFATPQQTPELEEAIAEVRFCAEQFSPETAHFANVWINNMLAGTQQGMVAGLLEECLLEDSQLCQRYEAALKRVDSLIGVGANEQY